MVIPFPTYGKIQNVPNHQSYKPLINGIIWNTYWTIMG
jgi:hypothetical protein